MSEVSPVLNYTGCIELLKRMSLDFHLINMALSKVAKHPKKLESLTRFLNMLELPWDLADDHNWEMLDQGVNDVKDFMEAAKKETATAHKMNLELMKKYASLLEEVQKITRDDSMKTNPSVVKLSKAFEQIMAS